MRDIEDMGRKTVRQVGPCRTIFLHFVATYVKEELSGVACYTDIRDSKSLISQSH